MLKRIICAVLLASFALFAFASCALKKQPETADPSQPVMSIGEEKVSLAVFKAMYDNYLPYMQYLGQDPTESSSSLEAFQDWLVDALSDDIVTLHQAKLAGFTLTPEQEKELEEQTENDIKELYDKLMKFAEEDYSEDPSIPVESHFESLVNTESEYYTGVAMSWEDYKNYYREEARKGYIVNAFKEHVCSEFEPSREDVTNWYDNAHDSDKANYADSPEKYKNDQEYFEQYYGTDEGAFPVTYVPQGYSRIMHIIVTPEGKLSDEYYAKTERMAELKKEYMELAFEDAVNNTDKNAPRMKEILDEYKTLKADTEEEYDNYIRSAGEKIGNAYEELASGTPFAEVMLKYTEDPKVVGDAETNGCEAFCEKGELISTKYTSMNDWSDKIKEVFSGLKIGEYSEVFFDEGSYHIIYYVSDEKAGDVDIDSIYDYIKQICLAEVQDSQWEALLEEWKKDPELFIDMDRIRQVGVEDLNKEGGE